MVEIQPVGPQRDAQIAERVFRWHYLPQHRAWFGADGELRLLDSWSTDDAASLDVLLAMEAQGRSYEWQLIANPLNCLVNKDARYCCAISDGPRRTWSAFGATIAAAVTEAALLAVGGA